MPALQKYLTIIGGLGALYLVAMHPDSFVKAGSAFNKATAGSVTSIVTGGAKGGA
jgi:hypothetical protein